MFILKQDLYTAILEDELEEITRGNNVLIDEAIVSAIEVIRGYLYDSFQVDVIFAATGIARHQLLVQYARDIAIYFLVARCLAGQALNDRRDRYDRAIGWLKTVAKSEFFADLPRRTSSTAEVHIRYGGNPKRSQRY
jgi:phage gp36-like protein